ncbi:ATP-dependent Clp protease proteolytic subunit, partial [Staphylococcus aureus]
MIFLNGDEFRVSDDAEFMIHTGAYGTRGKENNVRQQVEFFAKSNARLMYKYYKHFLTPEEIEAAIEGKDFWMNSDEIIERLE